MPDNMPDRPAQKFEGNICSQKMVGDFVARWVIGGAGYRADGMEIHPLLATTHRVSANILVFQRWHARGD